MEVMMRNSCGLGASCSLAGRRPLQVAHFRIPTHSAYVSIINRASRVISALGAVAVVDSATLEAASREDGLQHAQCSCGSHRAYQSCCGQLHAGKPASSAHELARARFTALLLGNASFLESTFHPGSPEVHRPSTLIKASRVMQALKPRLLEICHSQVPLSDAAVEEEYIVALALLVHSTDSSHPQTVIEADRFQLHNGIWLYHSRVTSMPSFGAFPIFWDRYGPGSKHHTPVPMQQQDPDRDPHFSRYRFDLVGPRRTPAPRRSSTPTPQRHPTPSASRPGSTPSPIPHAHTHSHSFPTGLSSRSTTPGSSRAHTPGLSRVSIIGGLSSTDMSAWSGARHPTPGVSRATSGLAAPAADEAAGAWPALHRSPTPGSLRQATPGSLRRLTPGALRQPTPGLPRGLHSAAHHGGGPHSAGTAAGTSGQGAAPVGGPSRRITPGLSRGYTPGLSRGARAAELSDRQVQQGGAGEHGPSGLQYLDEVGGQQAGQEGTADVGASYAGLRVPEHGSLHAAYSRAVGGDEAVLAGSGFRYEQ